MKTVMIQPTHLAVKSHRPQAVTITRTVSLELQSREIEGEKRVRVSRLLFSELFLSYLYSGCQTVYQCMVRGARISNNGPCLGYRETKDSDYKWLCYDSVLHRAKNFGAGLLKFELHKGSYLGLYSQNRVEYVIAEYGAYSRSMATVPLYDTLGPEASTWIINQTELRVVVCDNEQKARSLLSRVSETPSLKVLIIMDGSEVTDETMSIAAESGIFLTTFRDVESQGDCELDFGPIDPPAPEDVLVVCYTSGTTGNPKGVVLTHGNMISMISSVLVQMGDVAPTKDDVMLSFLPLAHVFERACETAGFMVGGRIGFFRGNMQTLSEDFKALKPTVAPCVPRLFNKMYDKIKQAVSNSAVKKALMDVALRQKRNALTDKYDHYRRGDASDIWDKSVFRPIRDSLGGRMRMMIVGAAPTSHDVLTFLRCALGCIIIEAYGQTEVSGACTMTLPADQLDAGHVGPPLPSCSIKLVDVPEMDYYASEGRGEICVKGPIVFQGYLKNPEETKAVLDENGWLHTGDIGTWLPKGTLRIIDRKKHIFKLSQGEYIAPEKIESAYALCPLVSQVFVHGESLKSSVVGIVVLDQDAASFQKLSTQDNESDDQVKNKVLSELLKAGEKAGLKSFEQVKDVYISPTPFTIENNLLTPTFKNKRPECRKFFKERIEVMYSKLN